MKKRKSIDIAIKELHKIINRLEDAMDEQKVDKDARIYIYGYLYVKICADTGAYFPEVLDFMMDMWATYTNTEITVIHKNLGKTEDDES